MLVIRLREHLGLIWEQSAHKVGVSDGSVNPYEKGIRKPQPFLVRRLHEMKEGLDAKVEVPLRKERQNE